MESDRVITISENWGTEDGYEGLYATHTFTFDHVYPPEGDQATVYQTTARAAVMSTLQVPCISFLCFLSCFAQLFFFSF